MKRFLVAFYVLLHVGSAFAQLPLIFAMDANRLPEVKKMLQPGNQELKIIAGLQKKADSLLSMKPLSVMDKEFMPVSGNKHDYMSQAPYFWYDSSKPNGLPYMRRDGVRNPEIYRITDRTYLGRLE
ncbi:MAG TPA: alginate lyase family protein, partial [Chitinophagaceae bacterium]|nr:alginate lyase family protein [Chitinophagaceae bacterium]